MPKTPTRSSLTGFEHLVLLSVLRRGDRAYGVSVLEELQSTAKRPANRAAVYVALRRLEQRGCLTSSLAEPTAERGGRAKRFYELTQRGREALEDERATLTRMWSGLEESLGS